MSRTLIIGDVHGCYQSLMCLLDSAGFNFKTDNVWLIGDAVNGGPSSLEVLRWVVDMEDRARVVLGNHAAQNDAAVKLHVLKSSFQVNSADIVEIDMDPIGAVAGQLRG